MIHKLYVSRNVTFLEHIPFYSIRATTHHLTKSDLLHIDPFDEDIEDRGLYMLHDPPVDDMFTSLDSSSTYPSPESAPLNVKIDDPPPLPLRRSTHPIKSTNLLDFAYSINS